MMKRNSRIWEWNKEENLRSGWLFQCCEQQLSCFGFFEAIMMSG